MPTCRYRILGGDRWRPGDMILANSLEYPERIQRGLELTQLANSLEYPEMIQRGLEWTQLLKRVFFVCLFFVCKFSHFPLSTFSFYTVKYGRVQYRTGIGQLPRVSGKDPERKEWTSVFETLVLCLSVCLSANFLIFLFQPWANFFCLYNLSGLSSLCFLALCWYNPPEEVLEWPQISQGWDTPSRWVSTCLLRLPLALESWATFPHTIHFHTSPLFSIIFSILSSKFILKLIISVAMAQDWCPRGGGSSLENRFWRILTLLI